MCLGNHGTVKDRHNDYESFFFLYFLLIVHFLNKQIFLTVKLLTHKLMKQNYQQYQMKSLFRKFYGHYNDIVIIYMYNLPLGRIMNDVFHTYY